MDLHEFGNLLFDGRNEKVGVDRNRKSIKKGGANCSFQ
jgi:hypothetical protein